MSNSIGFWERRREAVQAEAELEVRAVEKAILAERDAEFEKKSDKEILAELELPDPDAMEKGDNFSAFMQAAVPERIRARALRVLWRSNPILANVDNLVDYGDDFLAESKAGLSVKTAYQVGKGMLAHVEEMERQAEMREALEDFEGTEEGRHADEVEVIDVPDEERAILVVEVAKETPVVVPEIEQEQEPEMNRRRALRFEFAT